MTAAPPELQTVDASLDARAIAEFGAEHVLLATGSYWVTDGRGRSNYDPLPGFGGSTLTPDDLLDGHPVEGPVVIYDDDHYYMANALAAQLASQGHQVHIVTPLPTLSGWMGYTLEQARMVGELHGLGVKMYPNCTATAWTGHGLEIIRSDTGDHLPIVEAKTLVSVTLRQPIAELSSVLENMDINHRIIGDAEAPGTIQSAVYSGHRHAREILGNEAEDGIFKRERPTLFL